MHIADVHIGVTPDLNKPWSQARAQAVKDTFAALIGIAEKEQADLAADRRGPFSQSAAETGS